MSVQLNFIDYLQKDEELEKKKNLTNKQKPKMVSLFSGCGGMDLGFKQAGYDIIYANDFDEDAQKIYELNLGKIDKRDILDIDEKDIPDCDIICAGFPCQPFSSAGNRKGVEDDRGNLYKECLRIIEKKHPKVVVLENVRGLMSMKDEDGNKLLDTIIGNLEELGYIVSFKLLNSSDYGVPQNRYRLFIIALDKEYGIKFKFPMPRKEKERLKLKYVLDIDKNVPNQKYWELSPQAAKMIVYITEGGSWKDIPYEELPDRFKKIRDNMKKYRSPNFYRRFSREEINGTITASAQPENCGIIHPLKNRRYTIREIARIQSFPDDFLFIDESKRDIIGMYKVIGNAVPPKLAKVLAEEILYQFWSFIGEDKNEEKIYKC